MKKSFSLASAMALAIIWLMAVSAIYPAAAQGRSVTSLEGAKFDVASTIKDNLKIYTGKDVVIHLRSGKNLQGYVKTVGDHFVHIEKISGKDFYDALIRIEDITAIEAKFREMK